MALTLTLRTVPDVPLEADVVTPDQLAGLSAAEVAGKSLQYGNKKVPVGEFFDVSGQADSEIRVVGDLGRVKCIGVGMTSGRVVVDGNAGTHLGAEMAGGEILVAGNAGDWVGGEMTGGRIVVKGDAGHMVGSAYRGSPVGVRGGEIIVHGNVGNEAGNGMRRGLIVVGGNSGDFSGVNMLAGSLFVIGEMGIRTGAGMRRGTIVSMNPARMLPTFSYACTYRPTYLRLYLSYLRELGLNITESHCNGRYERWCGDAVGLNRGELLLLKT